MPIFEYKCSDCGKQFEAVVLGSKEPECPECHGTKLDQQLSKFAVGASKPGASRTAPCGAPGGMCGGGGCGMMEN